jgi:type II secretory pathway pseudopilin PulG
LLVVVVIISLIVGLILVAAAGGIRSAEEKATQSLISKLENAINDRVDALLQNRQDPAFSHLYMSLAYGNASNPAVTRDPITNLPVVTQTPNRAYVIAMTDYLKRELPDVFFVQTYSPGDLDYPLNFAAQPYPNPNASTTQELYVLPVGTGFVVNGVVSPGVGIYGASYTAAVGLYKNLGYLPRGLDGVDNNNNGLIDEWGEGVTPYNQAQVLANLKAHDHKTARSEVLYAILVEGSGPFGSIFSRDDFTDKEVQDTDGDGLPEFVDAWGQPLQFYRWPLLYHSDTQRAQRYFNGAFVPPYDSMVEEREQDPLDPNQTLMAPAWWSASANDPNGTGFIPPFPSGFTTGPGNSSMAVNAFETYFHSLHEPLDTTTMRAGRAWDRGAGPSAGIYSQRRAYYSKPLIVSWGPDKMPGIFGFYAETGRPLSALQASQPADKVASALIINENPAPQFDPLNFDPINWTVKPDLNDQNPDLHDQGNDDISNQALQAGGGAGSAP